MENIINNPKFQDAVFHEIYEFTKGIPRLINTYATELYSMDI